MADIMDATSSPSFVSSANSDADSSQFVHRVTHLPMVALSLAKMVEIYQRTKVRHELLSYALGKGEQTVLTSLDVVSGIATRTGLQGPLNMANHSACYMLSKVEEKLPIITYTPDEIKTSTWRIYESNVRPRIDQLQHMKENTVQKYNDVFNYGSTKLSEAKSFGAAKVKTVLDVPNQVKETLEASTQQLTDSLIKLMGSDSMDRKKKLVADAKANTLRLMGECKEKGTQTLLQVKNFGVKKVSGMLETPVGRKVSEGLAAGLAMADSVVERLLPEAGHSHKNGNGTVNGHFAHSNGNSSYDGNMDHAKSLSRKVKRRLSAKSSDVVDGLRKNPAVITVSGVAEKYAVVARQYTKNAVDATGKALTNFLMLLPGPVQSKITVTWDVIWEKLQRVSGGRLKCGGLHRD